MKVDSKGILHCSLDEYTKEETEKNGNQMYGGKRHDEICDFLQAVYGFDDYKINDISIGIWMAIDAEKKARDEFYKKEIERLGKDINYQRKSATEFCKQSQEKNDIIDKLKELIREKDYNILSMKARIKELEEKIYKLRSCSNCKHLVHQSLCRAKDVCPCKDTLKYWEMKE